MQSIIETWHSIDENSKKILYKEFKSKNVNVLSRHIDEINYNLSQISKEQKQMNMKSFDRVDTEDLKSESSGNYSDDDIINKIYEMQKIYHREI